MLPLQPRILPENSGLAWIGERVRTQAAVPGTLAQRMLRTRNPTGRLNSDIVRRIVSAQPDNRMREQWQLDFPADMNEREAAAYEHPFHHLHRSLREHPPRWWANPHANAGLRRALSRLERCLVTPLGGSLPAFRWLEADALPNDSLLVIARDDDFTHGILASRIFALWWGAGHSRRVPTRCVETFPFPWPPATALGSLTAAQQEIRSELARAMRAENPAAAGEAAARAYGWPPDLDDAELLRRLVGLNRARSA